MLTKRQYREIMNRPKARKRAEFGDAERKLEMQNRRMKIDELKRRGKISHLLAEKLRSDFLTAGSANLKSSAEFSFLVEYLEVQPDSHGDTRMLKAKVKAEKKAKAEEGALSLSERSPLLADALRRRSEAAEQRKRAMK